MNDYTIKIITYAYNVEKYIARTIQSVVSQSYPNWKWCLVENGSTDGTRNVIKKNLPTDPRIQYYENDWNHAIYPGKSVYTTYVQFFEDSDDYFMTLDSDDTLLPDALEILVGALDQYGPVDEVIAGCEMYTEGTDQIKLRLPPGKYYPKTSMIGKDIVHIYGSIRPVWGKLFKESIAQEVFRSKEMIYGNGNDTMINLLYLSKAKSVISVAKPTIRYTLRPNSAYYATVYPKRYLAYNKLHQVGTRLLEQWQALNHETRFFLENVRFLSMLDTIGVAIRNQTEPANSVALIDNINSDPEFYQGLKTIGARNEFLKQCVVKISEKVTMNFAQEKDRFFYTSFSCLIALAEKLLRQGETLLAVEFFFAGLFAPENQEYFGAELLPEFCGALKDDSGYFEIFADLNKTEVLKILEKHPAFLREALRGSFSKNWNNEGLQLEVEALELYRRAMLSQSLSLRSRAEIMKIEKELAAAYGRNAYEEAIVCVKRLLDKKPFHGKALQYKIALLAEEGDLEGMFRAGGLLRGLYPENPDLMETAAMAYAACGLPASADMRGEST